MPRNVDPTLSSTEETEAIKTAALIAARLELFPSEGFRRAEAVLKKLQPCLRDSPHSTRIQLILWMQSNPQRQKLFGIFSVGLRWAP